MLAVVPDRYDFKFSIKAAERKHRTEDSTHMQEIEFIGNRKVPTLPWKLKQKNQPGEIRFPKAERNIIRYFNFFSNHLFNKF